MTLEDRVREALVSDSARCEPSTDLWPGVVDRIERRGRMAKMRWGVTGVALVAMVAALLGVTAVEDDTRTEVDIHPATTEAPTETTAVAPPTSTTSAPATTSSTAPTVPRVTTAAAPAWARTFVGIRHQCSEVVYVKDGYARTLARGRPEVDCYMAIGIREREALYYESQTSTDGLVIVVHPLDDRPVTRLAGVNARLSADHSRLVYTTGTGAMPVGDGVELRVRALDSGDEKRFPFKGSRFQSLTVNAMAGDVVVFSTGADTKTGNELWALDVGRASSLDDAQRIGLGEWGYARAFDENTLVLENDRELAYAEPRTGRILRRQAVQLPAGVLESDGHGNVALPDGQDVRVLVGNRFVVAARGFEDARW